MNKPYFFVSDIHFGLESEIAERKKEELFVKFVRYAINNAEALFILGDLFDYWFEYKRVYQKGYYRTFSALKDLTDSGIPLHYVYGNHDFLHRDFFKKDIGAIMYEEPFEIILNEKHFFLGHGDGLMDGDTGYKILKKVLRNKVLQRLYGMIHPDIGVALASRTSKTSRNHTQKKDFGEEDGLFKAAQKYIDKGYDYVIFGHLHKRCFENYKKGYYINLGSWLEQPCYGSFRDNKYEIINWE